MLKNRGQGVLRQVKDRRHRDLNPSAWECCGPRTMHLECRSEESRLLGVQVVGADDVEESKLFGAVAAGSCGEDEQGLVLVYIEDGLAV